MVCGILCFGEEEKRFSTSRNTHTYASVYYNKIYIHQYFWHQSRTLFSNRMKVVIIPYEVHHSSTYIQLYLYTGSVWYRPVLSLSLSPPPLPSPPHTQTTVNHSKGTDRDLTALRGLMNVRLGISIRTIH